MPTGRLIVERDAPAQVISQRNHCFPGGRSGRPDLGLCMRLVEVLVLGLMVMVWSSEFNDKG